jgi:hypothetical protein
VLGQLFQVLEPASLEATARAMADAEQRHREQVAAFELALERARFEADRAMRKHDEVEPGNRLVARTLQARLEERLAAVQHAEAGLAAARARHPVRLTGEELAWLTRAGADIRAVFDAPATTHSQRKQLIRAVISEITLTIDRHAGTCHTLITWQGTATSAVTFPLPKRGSGAITGSEDIVSLIRRLAGQYNDTTIARILARQHRRTATGLAWTRDRVTSLRRCYGIPHCPEPPANVTGTGQDDVMATIPRPRRSSAWTRPLSTGGCATASSPASSSLRALPGRSASPRPCAARSAPMSPRGGCRWTRPPKCSASPGRPCCTRSSAASSTRPTSPADAAKACVSRSNAISLDYLTHHTKRKAQC